MYKNAQEKIDELRRQAADDIEKAEKIQSAAQMDEKGNRSLTKEQAEEISSLDTRAQGLLDEADRIEKHEAIAKRAGMREDETRSQKPGNMDPEAGPAGRETRKAQGPYDSFGAFLQDVRTMGTPGRQSSRDGLEANARLMQVRAASGMSEQVASDGGFLVQKDFATDLLKRAYDSGMAMNPAGGAGVRRVPVSGNGLKINAIDETSRATGSRFGGIQVYWLNEAAQVTAKKPKFRQMELTLKKLIGMCYLTDELLEDSAAAEVIAREAFAEEFAWVLDDAVINGDGSGKPLGILNSPALVSVSAETGQGASTILAENIMKMWSRMWARSRSNAVWFYNQDIEPQLFAMSLAVGTGGIPVFMPAGGLSQKPYSTLMGRPAIAIEQCQTLGTVGDILLTDQSQYLMIDKGGLKEAVSIHIRFDYDETAFRFTLRVDGQPIWNSALTPANGVNTVSPHVALETRS